MTDAPERTPPRIFDRALMRQRLLRALDRGVAVDFLLARAVEDMEERLSGVKRDFSAILDLGTPGPALSTLLAARPNAPAVTHLAGDPALIGEGRFTGLLGDEESLPFSPASFDLCVSALALQHVNDLPGALVQIRRALKPDGLFLGAMLGGRTLNELREAFAEAESQISGGASPRVAPFADLRDMGALLQRAGFALPVTDVDTVTVRYSDMFALLRDLRGMGATNALHLRSRAPLRRAVLLRAAEIYAERFADADTRLRATFEIVWLTGWSPHESQQKPLRPGSAQMRLADALGVKEQGTGDKTPR